MRKLMLLTVLGLLGIAAAAPAQASEEGVCVKALVVLPFAADGYPVKQQVMIGEKGHIVGFPATVGAVTIEWRFAYDISGANRSLNYGVVQKTAAVTQFERVSCYNGYDHD